MPAEVFDRRVSHLGEALGDADDEFVFLAGPDDIGFLQDLLVALQAEGFLLLGVEGVAGGAAGFVGEFFRRGKLEQDDRGGDGDGDEADEEASFVHGHKGGFHNARKRA